MEERPLAALPPLTLIPLQAPKALAREGTRLEVTSARTVWSSGPWNTLERKEGASACGIEIVSDWEWMTTEGTHLDVLGEEASELGGVGVDGSVEESRGDLSSADTSERVDGSRVSSDRARIGEGGTLLSNTNWR